MALIADFVTGKPVSFRRVRHLLAQMGLQEGVVGAGDLKAAQRAAGANMSADVAVGEAWVAVETGVRNGIAHLTNDAVANIIVPASDATNPTVHSVVAQYNDTAIPAGAGGDDPTFRLIAGTPTAGATLDNRNGAAAMPADALLLADVLVPAASTSVINANIRDRRRWARGARFFARDVGGTLSYGTAATLFNGGLLHRFEVGSGRLLIRFTGERQNNAAGGSNEQTYLRLNGTDHARVDHFLASGEYWAQTTEFDVPSLSPGSYRVELLIAASGGNSTLQRSGVKIPHTMLREIVEPSANNE